MNETNELPSPLDRPELDVPHPHSTKLTVLIILTLVMGMISIISLFFLMKNRETVLEEKPQPAAEEKTIEPDNMGPADETLNVQQTIVEMDNLKLQKIEEKYSEEVFDNN